MHIAKNEIPIKKMLPELWRAKNLVSEMRQDTGNRRRPDSSRWRVPHEPLQSA